MTLANYTYQKPIINEVFKKLHTDKKVVLAACPGAGKTIMTISIIRKVLEKQPNARILILTHGQTLLRKQWCGVLSEQKLAHCEIRSRDSAIDKLANIFVALPQNYRRIVKKIKHIDLLIIDEAHHYYDAELVKRLKNIYEPAQELLLTGTPSNYVNNPEWSIVGITVQELLTHNTIVDVSIELVQSTYDFTISDYTTDMALKTTTKFKKTQTHKTVEAILEKLLTTINEKTMIVCNNQKQALHVFSYLTEKQLSVVLCISDVSEGNVEIESFKNDETITFLVVVNRGILGFDFPSLVNVVDMTGSLNINKLFQLLCRAIRKPPGGDKPKRFIKLTTKAVAPLTHFVMSFVVALSHPRYYFTYGGTKRQMEKMSIPIENKQQFLDATAATREKKEKVIRFPDLPSLTSFGAMIKAADRGGGGEEEIATIYKTNFATVKRQLSNYVRSEEEALTAMKQFSSRSELRRENQSVYDWVKRNDANLFNIVYGYMPSRTYWNEATALEAAKKCTTRNEFEENYKGAYLYLRRNKGLVPIHKLFPKYTIAKATHEIKTGPMYYSETKLIAAYKWLVKENPALAEKLLSKKKKFKMVWNDEKLVEFAKKVKTVDEFRSSGAASYAYRHKKHHLVNHILLPKKVHLKHTIASAVAFAKQCKTKDEFFKSRIARYYYNQGKPKAIWRHVKNKPMHAGEKI